MLRVDELRCGACSDRDNDWTHRRSRSRTCTYGSEQDERSGPRRAEAFRRTTVPAPKIDAVDAIANRHVSVRVGKITGA